MAAPRPKPGSTARTARSSAQTARSISATPTTTASANSCARVDLSAVSTSFSGQASAGPRMSQIVKTLEKAVAEASALPEADQEQIGRQLLSHLEKLRQLPMEIAKSIRSLDPAEGKPLDLYAF